MSLKRKTISGVLWTFVDAFFVRGLNFVAMLFLARWLGPSDFGLIGMIVLFIGLGNSLVDSGLSASIIRTENADDRDFSTVFYMNMVLSVLVYAILFFAAPFISDFYDQEILTKIIRVYCISFIISAFSAIQLAILTKEMQFKRLTLLNVPSAMMGVAVGLVLGYNGYGVWSIVIMYLVTQFVLSFLVWIHAKWKPSFSFSKERLKYHYVFGYKLMLSGILNVIFKNSYNVLIGKFFPLQSLGYYERSQKFTEYPAMILTGIIERVSYPMMAQLQNNTPKMANISKRLVRFAFFVIAPIMLGAAAIAEPLFSLILGSEWLPAVPYFQILSIAFMLYPIHAFNINVLKVFGRSDLFLKLEIIKKVLVVLGIAVGFQYGILGLLWSAVVTSFMALLINTHYSGQLINYKTKTQLLDLLPILVSASITAILMYAIVVVCNNQINVIQLLAATFFGVTFYLSIHVFFKKSPIYEIISLIKKRSV